MKKLIYLLVVTLLSLSLTSCGTYVSAGEVYDSEVYVENDNVTVIIKYGTPVYYEGHLHYYIYNGLYWYPFWYENYWYFRSYTHIYPWGYDFHFRPHHTDYRFRPGHHGFRRPDHLHGHYGLPREGRVYHDNRNTRRPAVDRNHNPRPNNNPGMNNGRRPNVNPGNRMHDGSMRHSQQSRPANVGGGRRH